MCHHQVCQLVWISSIELALNFGLGLWFVLEICFAYAYYLM